VLASTSLGEEGIERVVSRTYAVIAWHLTVRLDAVLEAVKLPAGVAHLDSGLSDVDGDALTLRKVPCDVILTNLRNCGMTPV